MKRSKQVPLLVLGIITTVSGCVPTDAPSAVESQNYYATVEDCQKDWGEQDMCKPAPAGHSSGAAYLGPRYYWDHAAGRPMVVGSAGARAVTSGAASHGAPAHAKGVATTTVSHAASGRSFSRGGFGSSVHGFSGGG